MLSYYSSMHIRQQLRQRLKSPVAVGVIINICSENARMVPTGYFIPARPVHMKMTALLSCAAVLLKPRSEPFRVPGGACQQSLLLQAVRHNNWWLMNEGQRCSMIKLMDDVQPRGG